MEPEAKSKDKLVGSQWGGSTALAVYALLASGDNPNAETKLAQAVTFLKQANVGGTYALGIRCLVWSRLPQTPEVKALMKRDAAALHAMMKTQGPARGFYDYDARGSATAYSLSRSQYAVLGMWAAAQSGVEVPTDYWRKVEAAWSGSQEADGGWAYQKGGRYPVTAGMTAAGVASLLVAQEFTQADVARRCEGNVPGPSVARGVKWLAEHFDAVVDDEATGREYPFVTLYAVERVGMAGGRKFLGANDWYAKGMEYLLARQRGDGSWRGKGSYFGALPDTCFGILFLARGRSPLFMNKLEYESTPAPRIPAGAAPKPPEWNQRPRDVANLAGWVGTVAERELNWQVVGADAPLKDWHEAPILYVSGSNVLQLNEGLKQKLREYVEGGGLVLGHADCAGRGFATSFRKLGTELFPHYAFRELPADHPVYKNGLFSRDKWKTKPSVLGLSNGVRELMLLVPQGDLGRAWQSKAVGGNESAWQLGANIFFYTAERRSLRFRGESHFVSADPAVPPARSLAVARIRYDGNWDPEPGGWRRLANLLHNQQRFELNVQPVALRARSLAGFVVAHLTGTASFELDDASAAELKRFVTAGGTLVVDAAGGSAPFAKAAEAHLAALFPGRKLTVLPPDHPLYRSGGGAKPEPVTYRPFAQKVLVGSAKAPRVQGIAFSEKGAVRVFFSPEDLSCGLVGQSVDGVVGYDPATATSIMTRIISYAASAPPKVNEPPAKR